MSRRLDITKTSNPCFLINRYEEFSIKIHCGAL
jgi:hypothetical protein